MSDKRQVLTKIAHHFGELSSLFAQLAAEGPSHSSQQSTQTTRTNGDIQCKEFEAREIIKTFGDDGEMRIKIKGKPFEKFGVPVYEEDFHILGIDLDELRPGAHPFEHRVRAVLKDDGNPRKVIEVLG